MTKIQWNPVIAVKPNGIHAVGRIGTIDGTGTVTFGPRIQVSSPNFPVDGVGDEAADYDTAAADDAAFYYTWSDNRNRMFNNTVLVNEANVRFAKVPSP